MKYAFHGAFAPYIYGLIEKKRSLGYDYYESERILRTFDEFCREQFPCETHLTAKIVMRWAEQTGTEQNLFRLNRVSVIRELARHMNSVGCQAYILPLDFTKKTGRHIPYIFSYEELARLFREIDSCAPSLNAPTRHLVVSVIFRMIYCCGLRPVEARRLRREDVSLRDGVVKILESKGHKDRTVVVADDLLQLMRRYAEKVAAIYPDCPFFFPRYDGMGAYSKVWAVETFWRCFQMGGLTQFDGPRPRVYDFRHTFATECICRWMREWKDVDAMLPFLSAYMGHARFEDTAYYIHMVPDFYQRTGKLDVSAYETLLPEVYHEDQE